MIGPRGNTGFLAALVAQPNSARPVRHRLHRPQSRRARRRAAGPRPRRRGAPARVNCWRRSARASPRRASRTSRRRPGTARDGFQLSGTRRLSLPILADGERVVAQVAHEPGGPVVTVDGVAPAADAVAVARAMPSTCCATAARPRCRCAISPLDEAGDDGGGGLVRAPMHGKVLGILVENGRGRDARPTSRHHRGDEDGAHAGRRRSTAPSPRSRSPRTRRSARAPW